MFTLRGPEDQVIPSEELAAIFAATAGDGGPTFSWESDEGSVEWVIVGLIDDEWCYVSMLDSVDWSDLCDAEVADNGGRVEVVLCGFSSSVPRAAIVPRHVGLAALGSAPTFSTVSPNYVWRRQPR
ncbi:hypothetical protein ACPPVO_34980 [Dactylosporangium sp. McL0621]|uniref:hypothetical protein n=1 Tax=Dactylosporangium sp. McL0621 TaxID=3415678 RepID=UPI003CF7C9E2